MSISKTASIKSLVSGLSRSEKRHFKLYIDRLDSNKDVKFRELFDIIEANSDLEDEEIIRQLDLRNAQQYANLKRHLFDQILVSLRLQYSQHTHSMQIHEWMDYMCILRDKAMYEECLQYASKCHKLLNSKMMAYHYHLEDIKNDMYPFFSGKDSPDDKIKTNQLLHGQLEQLYTIRNAFYKAREDFYAYSFSKSTRESDLRLAKLHLGLERIEPERLNHYQSFLYHMSFAMVLYSNIQFPDAYRHLCRARKLLKHLPFLIDDTECYLMFSLSLSIIRFYEKQSLYQKLKKEFETYMQTIENRDARHKRLKYLIFYLPTVADWIMISRDYPAVQEWEKELKERLSELSSQLPEEHAAFLHFKRACLLAMQGCYSECLDQTLILTQAHTGSIPKELAAYAHLLQTLCHYRLDNFQFVENSLVSLRKTFINADCMTRVVELSLQFLRKGVRAYNFGLKEELEELILKLTRLKSDRFQLSSFYYFDFCRWFESIMQDVPVSELPATSPGHF